MTDPERLEGLVEQGREMAADARRYRKLFTHMGWFSRYAPFHDPLNPRKNPKQCIDEALDRDEDIEEQYLRQRENLHHQDQQD